MANNTCTCAVMPGVILVMGLFCGQTPTPAPASGVRRITYTGSTVLPLIKRSSLYLPLHDKSALGSSLSSEVISDDELHFRTAVQGDIS